MLALAWNPKSARIAYDVFYVPQGLEALGYTEISSKTSYLLLAYVRWLRSLVLTQFLAFLILFGFIGSVCIEQHAVSVAGTLHPPHCLGKREIWLVAKGATIGRHVLPRCQPRHVHAGS